MLTANSTRISGLRTKQRPPTCINLREDLRVLRVDQQQARDLLFNNSLLNAGHPNV